MAGILHHLGNNDKGESPSMFRTDTFFFQIFLTGDWLNPQIWQNYAYRRPTIFTPRKLATIAAEAPLSPPIPTAKGLGTRYSLQSQKHSDLLPLPRSHHE
jgi:hypothetical protein